MIKKLQLEDICTIHKTENHQAQYIYLDYKATSAPITGSYGNVSITPLAKNFNLTKKYDSSINDSLLSQLISIMKKKSYSGTDYDGRFQYEKEWLMSDVGIRKFVSRILMMSNSIAFNGRFGPFTGIIFDDKYEMLFTKIQMKFNSFTATNLYTHKNLGDKIIAFRTPKDNMPSWTLVYNNELYDFQECGNYSTQYDVLNISKMDMRKYKLERILKND